MWDRIETLIEESLALGFPGGSLLIEKEGETLYESYFGSALLTPKQIPVTEKTLFDIASLTKIFSITYALQYLITKGEITLEVTLGELIDLGFNDGVRVGLERERITIRDLLQHSAGFEPNPLFYDDQYNEDLYCQERHLFLPKLLAAPLIYPPGRRALYSDVDYMLLTFIVEWLVQEPLDCWLRRVFWQPLQLTEITYNPLSFFAPDVIAGTELQGNSRDGALHFPNMRQSVIWGEVQDEKAYHCMEGVSGHAGLFSNVRALQSLLTLIEGENHWFSAETVAEFRQGTAISPTFGLGWRLNQGVEGEMAYHFGDYASSSAFGHTGWTGALLLIDPKVALKIIYLTNRKHSAVVDPTKDPNVFVADTLPIGKYRIIVNEIYRALGLDQ